MGRIDQLKIPIWREGLIAFERAALARDPVLRGQGVPLGDGGPVMLIPGFMAGDASLGLMARWLREIGYRPCRAGVRANVDCTEKTVVRLEERLEARAERHGRRVRIVGQSRGGTMARILAVRRPDLVSGIVTLGSPLVDQFDVNPLVELQVRATALLGSAGVPGLFGYACRDRCCANAMTALRADFPPGVTFTSVYSRHDGIVGWRSCLDPAADLVEVDSSHCGMAVNAAVYRVVGTALAQPDAKHGNRGADRHVAAA